MLEKLKSFLQNDQFFGALLLIAVASASFVLGRASETANVQPSPIVLQTVTPSLPIMTTDTYQVVGGAVSEEYSYVASKAGTKYHHLTCPGAAQIKDDNKLFFKTALEAEAAGYTRAANCLK